MKRSTASSSSVLTLRIALKHMKPPVWRRIEILSTATFRDLHLYIQACMPWTDSHLHSFEKRDSVNGLRRIWCIEDRELAEEEGMEFLDEDSSEERTTLVSERLKKIGDICTYAYDFGDGWSMQ